MNNRLTAPLVLLSLLLLLSLHALQKSESERARHAANVAALNAENQTLRTRPVESYHSLPRKRLTTGEFKEFRPTLAAEITKLDIALRRVESITRIESKQHIDTLLATPSSPILTDSLFRMRWRDSWVSLSVEAKAEHTHIALTTCDTLLQVVHRIPYRWWVFSFGTKAIRQEIRSSNPHTRLIYAEYIELE